MFTLLYWVCVSGTTQWLGAKKKKKNGVRGGKKLDVCTSITNRGTAIAGRGLGSELQAPIKASAASCSGYAGLSRKHNPKETLARDTGRENKLNILQPHHSVYTNGTCKEVRNSSSGSVLKDRQPQLDMGQEPAKASCQCLPYHKASGKWSLPHQV